LSEHEKLNKLIKQLGALNAHALPKSDLWCFLEKAEFLLIENYVNKKSIESRGFIFQHPEVTKAGYRHVVFMGRPICLKAEGNDWFSIEPNKDE